MAARRLELTINGEARSVEAEPERRLLGVLRDDLDLTGAKYGCGEGRCGACTVLVDGQAVRSCLTRLDALAGKPITTVEGLEGPGGRLHPVQQAFLDLGALQCGYCTPGMVVAAVGLLAETPDPTEAQVVEALQGNLCRCGTYPRIVAAVRRAAGLMKGGAP